jgi:hypothetical protein
MLKMGVEPTTSRLSEVITTRLLLQLCYRFMLLLFWIMPWVLILYSQHGSQTHLSGPISMAPLLVQSAWGAHLSNPCALFFLKQKYECSKMG